MQHGFHWAKVRVSAGLGHTDSRGEPTSLAFPAARDYVAPLTCGPFCSLQSTLFQPLLSSHLLRHRPPCLLFHLQGPCDYTGPPWRIKDHLSSYTAFTSSHLHNIFCHIRCCIHRFQGLRCRHLRGDMILSPTANERKSSPLLEVVYTLGTVLHAFMQIVLLKHCHISGRRPQKGVGISPRPPSSAEPCQDPTLSFHSRVLS